MARSCYVALVLGAIVLLSLHMHVNASGKSPDQSDEAGAKVHSGDADEEGGGNYRSAADRAADREKRPHKHSYYIHLIIQVQRARRNKHRKD